MNRRRAFTFFEVIIVVLIVAIVFGLLGTFVWRNARVSRATDRKLQAISAVHYLEGRVRRDFKGAKTFAVEEAGRRLVVTDMQDRKRVYQFNREDGSFSLPDLADPGVAVPYQLARFREALFIADTDGGGITFVFSAVPYYDRGGKLTDEELGWGSAVAGRVILGSKTQMIHYPGANLLGL